jgi:virginiamycin B lyase
MHHHPHEILLLAIGGIMGGIMSKPSLVILIAAGFVWPSLAVQAQDLPAGPGKEVATTYCNACHTLLSRVGNGYTAEGWHTVLRMMVNRGVVVPPEQVAALEAYLVASFPEKSKPAGIDRPGPARITIKSWEVPTPGSRPHDPLAAHDGALWYTGQMANVLGRLDPNTGQFKEYPLKTAHSGPHGLVEDKAGNIWYTGNTGALVGKLDPKTGAVTEYLMQDPNAKDPHSLVFDQSEILWFTLQNSNMVGRLDPKTSNIKLITVPTPNSRPYGIQVTSKGAPVTVLFGTNKVASIDPQTLAIKEYALPNADSRPRRLAITSDDIVWYTDFARGYLGRLDLKTGDVKEWLSPGGEKSEPYGISAINDVLWYSESGTKPNTVVRFDPKSGQFQTWAIPGGGNIVRNTDVTRDGNFVMANSLVNALSVAEIAK